MATESVATTTVPVPRAMLEVHPNSIAVPIENDFSKGRHVYKRGEWVLVDLDAVPEHDDFVVVFRPDAPFARVCYIAPVKQQSRSDMVMGVLDEDGDSVHMIRLGKDGREFGVIVGKIPPKPKPKQRRAVVDDLPEVQS